MSLTGSQQSEVVTTIRAETVSRRKLPVNLEQDDIKLFRHELEKTIPASHLLRFDNVRVSSEGILFKGIRILPQSFAYASELKEWKLRTVVRLLATNSLVRHRRRIDRDVLWITDYWSVGYFHWLADALTRLFVVRDRLDDLLLILPFGYEARDLVQSSLNAFGVNEVEFIGQKEVLECRSLFMPTHTAPSGHYHDEAIRGVRSALLSAYGEPNHAGNGERIYISRSRANKRRVVNESDLVHVLRSFGFQIICAEELSFERQVQLCSRARYLVSNHGAGLTNMLFMREGGSVLEFRHQTDYIRNWFFNLSSALNLNYFYQTCAPQKQDADPHTADLIVDLGKLERNLNLMLAHS